MGRRFISRFAVIIPRVRFTVIKKNWPKNSVCPLFVLAVYEYKLAEDSDKVRYGAAKRPKAKIVSHPAQVGRQLAVKKLFALFLLIYKEKGYHRADAEYPR